MTVETDLYTALTGNAGYSALCSTRLYPNWVPQDATLPASSYTRVSGIAQSAHDGAVGFGRSRFQLTHIATTYSSVRAVADAARDALTGTSAGTIWVFLLDNEREEFADTTERYAVYQDFIVTYSYS